MDYANPITAGDLTRYHAANLRGKADRLTRTAEVIQAEADALYAAANDLESDAYAWDKYQPGPSTEEGKQ